MNISWESDDMVDLGDGKVRDGLYHAVRRDEAAALRHIAERPPDFAVISFSKSYQFRNDFDVLPLAKEKAEKLRSAGCGRVVVLTGSASGAGYIYDTAKPSRAVATTDH